MLEEAQVGGDIGQGPDLANMVAVAGSQPRRAAQHKSHYQMGAPGLPSVSCLSWRKHKLTQHCSRLRSFGTVVPVPSVVADHRVRYTLEELTSLPV